MLYLPNKNSTSVLKALFDCHLCYSTFFSLTSLGVESYVCVLCLIIAACSLFSPRVWSFPRCWPFTPPQPVASLTAPRHLVPRAPSWTPNYRPRPMLMIDFKTRCLVYSLPLPQCKFAKAAKGGLRSCSAVLRRFKAWLSYLFLWFNSRNCPKAVWYSWRKRSVSISIPFNLNGSSVCTFSHRRAIWMLPSLLHGNLAKKKKVTIKTLTVI